ncbi:MAG TPA: methionine synthase I [Gammaproteobacteria bacterium]|nr:methionine synthase I [Gammaproteobacteria bacterium]|tara:strand:+ start:7047 stop:8078 length:1032 start_codon:yes stop_codon:yes gene_type:complete
MNKLEKLLQQKPYILADGATGTNLFSMGLQAGDPPEPWNILHTERVRKLHQGFVDSGSDIFLTNSFGCTSFRLRLHKFEKQVFDLNRAAAKIAREVADSTDRTVIVAGSMGPTGEMIEPHGSMTTKEAMLAFREQAEGLVEGGVDALWLETMYSIEELEVAVEAVQGFNLPVCATMSFDTAGKTMMGFTPSNLAVRAEELGLFGFGANCGVGASDLLATITDISRNVEKGKTVIAKANCGIPEYRNGEIVYTGTESLMADYVHLALNSGAKIVGGCCGTTFRHVAAMRKAMDEHQMGSPPSIDEVIDRMGEMSQGSKSIYSNKTHNPTNQRSRRRHKKQNNSN